jgi:membrane-associated phospholipid phosphatase
MDFISNIDTSLFYFFNQVIANSLFDKLMPFVTENRHWVLVYVFLFGWLFWKGGKTGRIAGLLLIVGLVIADQLSSSVIKELVARVRPCRALSDVRLLVSCGAGLSFPSSHATNTFFGAVILSYYMRQYTWVYFSIAALVSFSRVYCGVHYPIDILAGAILGSGIGCGMIYIANKIPALKIDIKNVTNEK